MRARCSTKELIPPSKQKSCSLPLRSSSMTMRTPAFRNASSRSRCESTSNEYPVLWKISASGWKVTLVPVPLRRPHLVERCRRIAALVALGVDLAVAFDLDREPLAQRVHDRDADAMEAARDLVGILVELAAGMERGEHHLGRRAVLGRVHPGRNAAPIVDHGDRVALVDRDVDLLREAGQGLVDGVVDDLVDEMMETIGTRGPDVHRRAFSDWIEALEHLDGTGVVAHRNSVRAQREHWGPACAEAHSGGRERLEGRPGRRAESTLRGPRPKGLRRGNFRRFSSGLQPLFGARERASARPRRVPFERFARAPVQSLIGITTASVSVSSVGRISAWVLPFLNANWISFDPIAERHSSRYFALKPIETASPP